MNGWPCWNRTIHKERLRRDIQQDSPGALRLYRPPARVSGQGEYGSDDDLAFLAAALRSSDRLRFGTQSRDLMVRATASEAPFH